MRGKSVWDDPELKRLRKRINGRTSSNASTTVNTPVTVRDSAPAQKSVKKAENDSDNMKKVNLNLNISIPNLKLNKTSKKPAILLAGIAAMGVVGLGIYKVVDRPKNDDAAGVLAENVIEPEFDTVLPDGSKESTEENKIGYDPQKKVASFKDTIDGVSITVSQQPLPEQLKANADEEVKKIAESFTANIEIKDSNPKAYLGNDVSGAQTVIFHKNDVLIFILSPKKIDNAQWAEYITTLR